MIKKWKNQKPTYNIDLYTRFLKDQYQDFLNQKINEVKSDNRIKNLQLLTHKQNIQKSKNRPIISTNIETGEERRYISIKTAAIELDISAGNISKVCRKKGKSLSSKKDGYKYAFKYLD